MSKFFLRCVVSLFVLFAWTFLPIVACNGQQEEEAKINEEFTEWSNIREAVANKDYGRVNEFIKSGGDFNMPGFGQVSLLILSINLKNIEMVQLLVQNGADVNLRVKRRSPLSFALEGLMVLGGKEWTEIVEYLQQQGATKEGNRELEMRTYSSKEEYSPTPFLKDFSKQHEKEDNRREERGR